MLQAEEMFRRAMRVSSADGTDKNVSPMVLTNLARSLIELEHVDEAGRLADRAYASARDDGDENIVRDVLLVRARVHRKRGEFAQAESLLEDFEERLRKTRPPKCGCFASPAYERAMIALARGDRRGAATRVDEAVAFAEGDVGHPDLAPYFRLRRAEVELALDRTDAARVDSTKAIELYRTSGEQEAQSSYLGLAYLALGRVLLASGPSPEAATALSSALEQLRPTLGPDHPQTRLAERLAVQAASKRL
jgi:ATP/maltotriose-dependent transcriptional regulator MalT